MSFGMQSTAPHVLAVLERTHTPGRAVEARRARRGPPGFEHVNLDLIYATPGETEADFAASLDAATGSGADHVSAYSLIVEDGTRLAARIRRGELPDVDDDVAADRYLQADAALTAAGLRVVRGEQLGAAGRASAGTTWPTGAATTGGASGPGAHAHVGGVRWWNVRHPAAYADAHRRGRVAGAGARGALAPRTAGSRTCCCACGCARGSRSSGSTAAGPRGRGASRRPTASPRRRRTTRAGWCSPCAAACSPTPSSATSSTDPDAAGCGHRGSAQEADARAG